MREDNLHIFANIGIRKGDNHILTAKHITRTHQNRVTEAVCTVKRLLLGEHRFTGRTADAKLLQQCVKTAAILRRVNTVCRSTHNRNVILHQAFCQFNRGLTAKGHHRTDRLFNVCDMQHVLRGQRFKVKPIRRIKVGRNRLRVVIDNDNLITGILQRPHTVYRGIVKLDSLADPNRTAAQNHHNRFAAVMLL